MPHFGIPPLVFISLFLGISGVGDGVAGWIVLCLTLDSMVRCEFACRYSWFKFRRDHGLDLLPCEPKFISNWRCEVSFERNCGAVSVGESSIFLLNSFDHSKSTNYGLM